MCFPLWFSHISSLFQALHVWWLCSLIKSWLWLTSETLVEFCVIKMGKPFLYRMTINRTSSRNARGSRKPVRKLLQCWLSFLFNAFHLLLSWRTKLKHKRITDLCYERAKIFFLVIKAHNSYPFFFLCVSWAVFIIHWRSSTAELSNGTRKCTCFEACVTIFTPAHTANLLCWGGWKQIAKLLIWMEAQHHHLLSKCGTGNAFAVKTFSFCPKFSYKQRKISLSLFQHVAVWIQMLIPNFHLQLHG